MSSVTTPPSLVPSPSPNVEPRPIPSLDEIYEWTSEPDLGIEVDISPSKIDRPGIYAALKVSEVWRFDGESEEVVIERLGEDGSFHPVEGSTFLPIRAKEVRRWVVEEDSSDESAWARRLRAWVRAELAPRLPR